jgi:hypothetical protein
MFKMYGFLRYREQSLRQVLLFMVTFYFYFYLIFIKEDLDIENKDNYADLKKMLLKKRKGKKLCEFWIFSFCTFFQGLFTYHFLSLEIGW